MSDTIEIPEAHELIGKVAILVSKAKENWMGGLLGKRLPLTVREWIYSKSESKRRKAADFIQSSGYQLKEFPDHCELWQNDEFLGSFKVEFKDGKAVCYEQKRTKK